MTTPPKWAQDLILAVWLKEGREDLPVVTWRRNHKRASRDSSGRGWSFERGNRLVITAGTNRLDQKVVLLHESAHVLLPAGEHHGAAFWDKAWELYKWAKLPIRYCKQREGNYRKGAVLAYARSRKPKGV